MLNAQDFCPSFGFWASYVDSDGGVLNVSFLNCANGCWFPKYDNYQWRSLRGGRKNVVQNNEVETGTSQSLMEEDIHEAPVPETIPDDTIDKEWVKNGFSRKL